jgi:altronate dehydratase
MTEIGGGLTTVEEKPLQSGMKRPGTTSGITSIFRYEVMDDRESLGQAGTRIYEAIETVASGTKTKAEISGYVQAMDIYVTGPVI